MKAEFALANGFNRWDEVNTIAPSSWVAKREAISIEMSPAAESESSRSQTLSSSFDTSLSVPFFHWYSGGATITDDLDDNYLRLTLDDATTVTATRGKVSTSNIKVQGEIVEFSSAIVKAVFHDTVTVSTTNTSAVSSSVNATKANCVAVCLGWSTDDTADNYDEVHTTLSITGSDGAVTVTATRNNAATTTISTTASFAIIEFQSGVTVQEELITMTGGNLSSSNAITAVDLSKAMSFWGGWQTDQSGITYDAALCRAFVNSTTQVNAARGDSTGTASIVITVVETANAPTSIERDTASAMGDADTTTAITLGTTLTNRDNAFLSWLGCSMTDTVDVEPQRHYFSPSIANTTTVNLDREVAVSGLNLTTSYEVIQD